MWVFNRNDGPICRANFKDTEDFYNEHMASYNADLAKLDELYEDILSQVHEGCDLVDNQKFLMFITDNRSDQLADGVRQLFLTEEGAEAFTDADDLKQALSEMYYQRVDFGLENPVVYDLPPFLSTDTCSVGTQEVAIFLQHDIYDGL